MKPAPFTYHRPETLDDALALLAEHGADASPLAGGQSLVPMLNMRLAQPAHIVDLNGLTELGGVVITDGWLEIGALIRHHQLAHDPVIRAAQPLLAHAAGTIAHYAIRQRGTLGGSLVQADPAGQLPLIARLTDAEVVIRGPRGERRMPVRAFLVFAMEVALEEGELVTAVSFPLLKPGTRWGFELFSRRRGDYALASVATTLTLTNGKIGELRLAIGAAASLPQRLTGLERSARGGVPDAAWIAETARAAAAAAEVEDSPQAPAAFRRELVEVLTHRALTAALTPEPA
ncbi:MAG: xanthine dehydrogenase family protein subunit M [Pseudomonadota bacterium]